MVTIVNSDTGNEAHWYSGPESTYWTDGFGIPAYETGHQFISKFAKTRLLCINRMTVPATIYKLFNFEIDELTA